MIMRTKLSEVYVVKYVIEKGFDEEDMQQLDSAVIVTANSLGGY